jgi:hypothetical protein
MARVTAPPSRLIFCEGNLDSVLLHQIIPAGKAEIKEAGGKRGMRAFIEGHLSGYGTNQPDYLGFRDRDFDVEPPDTPQLIRLPVTKPIWMSYRACIENYFVDSQLLYKYWKESAAGPNWGRGAPPAIEIIEEHILHAARELAEYQAIRWALAKLKPDVRWPEVGTTWTEGSGDLPSSLAFEACLDKARKLVDDFRFRVDEVSIAKLEQAAQHYRAQFNQDEFYARKLFVVWYHGKDLLVHLSKRLTPNFSWRHYASWAASHIDVNNHPDLRQLAEMCA